jgi:hypothetical protein
MMGLIVTMYNCHVSVRMAMYMKLAYTDSLEPYTNDTVLMSGFLIFSSETTQLHHIKWNIHQYYGILQQAHIVYIMYSLKKSRAPKCDLRIC